MALSFKLPFLSFNNPPLAFNKTSLAYRTGGGRVNRKLLKCFIPPAKSRPDNYGSATPI